MFLGYHPRNHDLGPCLRNHPCFNFWNMHTRIILSGTNTTYCKCLTVTMERLVWFGWKGILCKYWCLSVGLICKSVVSSPSDKWMSRSGKRTQFLLNVYVNLILGWWLFRFSVKFWSSFFLIYLKNTRGLSFHKLEAHLQIHPCTC